MKIIIDSSPTDGEDEIIIRSSSPDQRLISMLLAYQSEKTEISGYLDDTIVRLSVNDIYYFESLENHVFAYCESVVYEVKYKLFELEEMFASHDFIRCSKSVIISMEKIESLSAQFNGRLEARLKNGEKIIISRKYVQNLKMKLGI